jgi:acyl-CoA synthetase (AMP-forming)/AMP-acid ligase II
MASYKKPQFIEFVKEIPKLSTGKVDKVTVRKKYGALY